MSLSQLSLLPRWLRAGSGSGSRLRCGGPLQKVGTGAKERLEEGKQLSVFSTVSEKSELRSFKLVSHVQNCSLSSGSEKLMANSDGG